MVTGGTGYPSGLNHTRSGVNFDFSDILISMNSESTLQFAISVLIVDCVIQRIFM